MWIGTKIGKRKTLIMKSSKKEDFKVNITIWAGMTALFCLWVYLVWVI